MPTSSVVSCALHGFQSDALLTRCVSCLGPLSLRSLDWSARQLSSEAYAGRGVVFKPGPSLYKPSLHKLSFLCFEFDFSHRYSCPSYKFWDTEFVTSVCHMPLKKSFAAHPPCGFYALEFIMVFTRVSTEDCLPSIFRHKRCVEATRFCVCFHHEKAISKGKLKDGDNNRSVM